MVDIDSYLSETLKMIVKFFDYPRLYSEHSKDYESILKKLYQKDLIYFKMNL